MQLKKFLIIFRFWLLIGILVLFMGPTMVSADITPYQINYTILDPNTKQPSSIDDFFDKPATVTLLPKAYQVQFDVELDGPLVDSGIQSLTVGGQIAQTKVISTNDNEKIYRVTFTTTTLKTLLDGAISLDGQKDGYQFNFKFAPNTIPTLDNSTTVINDGQKNSLPNQQPASSSSVQSIVKKPTTTVETVTPQEVAPVKNSMANSEETKKPSQVASNTTSMSEATSSSETPASAATISAHGKHPHHNEVDKQQAVTTKEKAKPEHKVNSVFLTSIGVLFVIVAGSYWRSLNHK